MFRLKNIRYGWWFSFFLTLEAILIPFKAFPQPSPSQANQTIVADNSDATTNSWLTLFETLIERSYLRAIEDAYLAQSNEITSELWPISSSNPQLIWRDNQGEKQVLVVTWTNWDGYDEQVGKSMPLSREVWVTAVPEVQQFARLLELDSDGKMLRLEQYLGLKPRSGKTRFVQMWVNPADLFRPCPDPEITDTTCQLQFPASVLEEHKAWIIQYMLSSYGLNGYPWTRLGYTYDWGNPTTEIGASEFVIREGAEVFIDSVSENENYW